MKLPFRISICALAAVAVWAADFRAGTGRVKITPAEPIWLSGYASRKKPSEGIINDLWAKALALQDNKGGRLVIVTTDLIGLPRSVSDVVAARAAKQYKLERSRLLLNSSHTHTGPVVRPNLITMYDLTPEQERVVTGYTQQLTDHLVSVIGAALGDLQPADLSYGAGEVGFAVNRRQFTPKAVTIGINPGGAVDHSVPVLKITGQDGKAKAILFGYACHNTTLTGEHYQISGDYAGFAQSEIEQQNPGATAMFMMLCGGDQNPNPRSTLEYARQHGRTLASEVRRVAAGKLERVRGPLRVAYRTTDLALAPHTREDFEKMLGDSNAAKVRLAKAMLKAYDERRPARTVLYPVQGVRFGKDLTLLALGGEVVVDYALRAKREFPGEKLIVAGYSNDVMCYIPSARVLKEGGYEAVTSMIYYGQPASFAPDVEERVFAAIREVMKRLGR
ncbi:MAG: neutral/alkaline non-lysosomal ceramidase N-terminal domain-containing protein [Acidobacteria bacterium]|nr:neutral/alkaline non-lysosomal ceramidase N-terminal domain-containing protein [Acidobacteriota bacterium]